MKTDRVSARRLGASALGLLSLCCLHGCGTHAHVTVVIDSSGGAKGADRSGPARLSLPMNLGPAAREAPSTLEALLEEHGLQSASMERFREALGPYIGAAVRWRLRSWGGEVSTDGFRTPGGRQPPSLGGQQIGRIRLVSAELGSGATLIEVREAGHPVVACLAVFPGDSEGRFARSDDRPDRTPTSGIVTIEAVLWGVTYEGGPVLWLHDCSELAPPGMR